MGLIAEFLISVDFVYIHLGFIQTILTHLLIGLGQHRLHSLGYRLFRTMAKAVHPFNERSGNKTPRPPGHGDAGSFLACLDLARPTRCNTKRGEI